jgi:arylsulfatase A-like enzyme
MSNTHNLYQLSRRDFLKIVGCVTLGGLFSNKLNPMDIKLAFNDLSEKPNFLIIVLDTLSARHMSTYGYARQTTPNISRFAERAVVYHNHQAAGNYTPPGTASILTGTYPWSHRAMHTSGTIQKTYTQRNIFNLLAEDYYTLAYTHNSLAMTILYSLQAGITQLIPFESLSLQENTVSSSCLWKDFNLADWAETIIRGVGHPPSSLYLSLLDFLRQRPRSALLNDYREEFPRGLPSANLDARYFVMEDVVDWLLENLIELPRPYFAYFHLIPPHEPYTPRKEFVDAFRDGLEFPEKARHYFSNQSGLGDLKTLRREYDEYLAYADAEFGRLYDGLCRSKALENTYLILTSDHGQLFERGIHGHVTPTLYAPLLHVPLLIARPENIHQRVDVYDLTSAVDLAPTLMQIVGKTTPDWMEGNVLPGFDKMPVTRRSVYAVEAKASNLIGPLKQGTVALINEQFKLVHYFGYPGFADEYEMFNRQDDPQELNNLYRIMAGTASEMSEQIRRTLSERGLIE